MLCSLLDYGFQHSMDVDEDREGSQFQYGIGYIAAVGYSLIHKIRKTNNLVTLGVRGSGNCQKHLENIVGCGSNFLQCNHQTHAENIWDVLSSVCLILISPHLGLVVGRHHQGLDGGLQHGDHGLYTQGG